jgi:hypothetical protein
MKFTLSWLKGHLDPIATVDGIAVRPAAIGRDAESVDRPADAAAGYDADVRWLNHYGFRPLDLPSLAGGLSS